MQKVILCIFILFISGCIATSKPYTKCYQDPAVNLNSYSKFYICPPDSKEVENPLINKNINNIIKEQLINKGYIAIETPTESDFFIVVDYANSYKESYVPPAQIYLPFSNTETTNYRGQAFLSGDVSGSVMASGHSATQKTTYLPITTGGYYQGFYYPCIYIYMHDMKRAVENYQNSKSQMDTLFWSGSAITSTNEADIVKSAPELISSALKQFPNKDIKNSSK